MLPAHRFAAALLAATIFVAPAAAADLAALFGTRDSVQQISLSPDGSQIAYVAPVGDRATAIYVANLAGGTPQQIGAMNGKPERILDCAWVANTRLACRIYAVVQGADIMPVTRMIALDADGKNVKMLSQSDSLNLRYSSLYGGSILDLNPGDEGSVLLDRWFAPESQNNPSRLTKTREGYGVVKVNTKSLATTVVQDPDLYAADFLSDGHGHVRVMGIQPDVGAGEVVKYSYRTGNNGAWRPLGQYNVLTDDGFNPFAVDPQINAVYGLQKVGGRQALYRISLDGSARQELVFAHPQVDVDNVVRIGRSRRPVGASFVTDRRQTMYFDAGLKQLADALGRSLPNQQIDFVDSSQDESKLLLRASSDVDPGRLYVFDRAKRQLNEIMLLRPELEGVPLAKVQSVTYRTADGSNVPAYLTLPPKGPQKGIPAIVMPHGGPSARDEWGFDWLPQFYAAAGYAVIQPNYRGSTGYGDDWYMNNGFQSWKTAIGDVADAGRWLVSQGIADPARLGIVGWSYGGYAALQSAATNPGLFKAVVAIAPVTDLEALKEEFRGWSNHAIESKFIGQGPHIREGSPARNAERITAPVMLFHGTLDRNVSVLQSERMASRLKAAGKDVELVTYADLDHSLPDSRIRADMLRLSDQFLKTSFGK
jgi:dipeptidyl aminopeptidase/acylaminoacyl peptidase